MSSDAENLTLLVSAAKTALLSYTGRVYPQASLDRITTLGRNSLEVQLLEQTGKLEFGFNMSRKLKKALPQHLWGSIKGIVDAISTCLDNGEGFQTYGDKADLFFAVTGALSEDFDNDFTEEFIGMTFQDVVSAVETTSKAIKSAGGFVRGKVDRRGSDCCREPC
ncbi:hypothetical protein B0H13DRAFT_1884685 [Mycena leptocephala]|nr:hypothetical protein B0H13DRAFT_1884685 [Mycena leptocephala]